MKTRVLHLLGIDDTHRIRIQRLGGTSTRDRYSFIGNVEVQPLLDPERFSVFTLMRGGMKSTPIRVPEVDVILNSICDPDTNDQALKVAAVVAQHVGKPVVNAPERVRSLTRDALPGLLAGEPGIVAPATRKISPRYVDDVAAEIAAGALVPPFLFREAGTHGGTDLVRVEHLDDIHLLERFAFDGRSFYVTDYVDFRSPDGLFRKYRVLLIGSVPFAKHLIVSDEWMIHARDRDRMMADRPDLLEEEAEFLRTFGPETFPALGRLGAITGLDYFGIDFTIGPAGEIIVFEVNACVRALTGTATTSSIASHQESTEAIKQAFGDLLVSRAQSA